MLKSFRLPCLHVASHLLIWLVFIQLKESLDVYSYNLRWDELQKSLLSLKLSWSTEEDWICHFKLTPSLYILNIYSYVWEKESTAIPDFLSMSYLFLNRQLTPTGRKFMGFLSIPLEESSFSCGSNQLHRAITFCREWILKMFKRMLSFSSF